MSIWSDCITEMIQAGLARRWRVRWRNEGRAGEKSSVRSGVIDTEPFLRNSASRGDGGDGGGGGLRAWLNVNYFTKS